MVPDFTSLLEEYSSFQIVLSAYAQLSRRSHNFPGVYLIFDENMDDLDNLLYIGSSGSIKKHLQTWKLDGNLYNRIYGAWTPYHLRNETFYFNPQTSLKKAPLESELNYAYHSQIPLNQLRFKLFNLSDSDIAPLFLESSLLQAYFKAKKSLPPVNQKL